MSNEVSILGGFLAPLFFLHMLLLHSMCRYLDIVIARMRSKTMKPSNLATPMDVSKIRNMKITNLKASTDIELQIMVTMDMNVA